MTKNQIYAARRMSLAVDRVIRKENAEQAKKWVAVWHKRSLKNR